MRLPTRKSEILRQVKEGDEDRYLTPASIECIKREIDDLVGRQRPEAAAEVRRTGEMGDFSENAAYQMAKGRLRQINGRVAKLEERIRYAIPIDTSSGGSGRVRIGSTVVLECGGKQVTYEILGSQETNPLKGRISYLSPLGVALMGHAAGDILTLEVGGNHVPYVIVDVR
ncbi:GreA/GreB family elongation factor [Candidatus Uhrbacteria bacterium]|nr:GreA/GreB family elongation factor [Candidatus Uhrbacteria bacterium]